MFGWNIVVSTRVYKRIPYYGFNPNTHTFISHSFLDLDRIKKWKKSLAKAYPFEDEV